LFEILCDGEDGMEDLKLIGCQSVGNIQSASKKPKLVFERNFRQSKSFDNFFSHCLRWQWWEINWLRCQNIAETFVRAWGRPGDNEMYPQGGAVAEWSKALL